MAHDRVEQPLGPLPDLSKSDVVFTFEGLIRNTSFVTSIRESLEILQAGLGTPVDIEFAFDGTDLCLLQCRPQSYAADTTPVPIPQNLRPQSVIFSANRFVSNGRVPEITRIVYVELEADSNLAPPVNEEREQRLTSEQFSAGLCQLIRIETHNRKRIVRCWRDRPRTNIAHCQVQNLFSPPIPSL